MTAIAIRDCRPGDLPAIARIYGHWVETGRASFELSPPGEEEMERRRDAILAGGYPYIVAEDADGTVLGYAYVSAYRPRPAYRHAVENSVYVSPEAGRGGIGRALLTALIARCEAADFRLMVAVIGDSANAPSIGLHAALGFRHVGVLPSIGWKHEQWLDTVLMVLPLGPGDTAPPGRP
ncbi:N-acetyltransferase family protein [Muricoccus radiodurans]|uniref:GNAT family N-acetyltransferase n=1 Tax=Muricoccus radiodurans TaxID=2231721 RepID=UPI003CEF1BB6